MITGRRHRPAAMRADVTRAAGNQNGREMAHASLVVSDRCFGRFSEKTQQAVPSVQAPKHFYVL
jgi:hypothetical protein